MCPLGVNVTCEVGSDPMQCVASCTSFWSKLLVQTVWSAPSLSAAMVGDVNLFFNNPNDTSAAEINVMIAEPGCRGRGLGTEAVTLMMSYGM